jgi:hypothetical protein
MSDDSRPRRRRASSVYPETFDGVLRMDARIAVHLAHHYIRRHGTPPPSDYPLLILELATKLRRSSPKLSHWGELTSLARHLVLGYSSAEWVEGWATTTIVNHRARSKIRLSR